MSSYLLEQRVAEAVAREAGRRMIHARAAGFDVSMKGANDLVTNIDRDIEGFIKSALIDAFPGDSVLGEEKGVEGESEGRRWFVDPIDGTMNFVQGIPMFCVSIGLSVGGERQVGVIYDPNRDELFSGRRGALPHLDGREIHVTDVADLDDAVVATGFAPGPGDDTSYDNLNEFVRMSVACRGTRRLGSAAIDLAYVACGRLDGFWEFNLNPWDTAAGALLVELAGGSVTSLDGSRYTGSDRSVVATNGRVHDEMIAVLRND